MMIGDFTDRGLKLFTEKAEGNICGCVGFAKDRNTGLNVPNTLLKKRYSRCSCKSSTKDLCRIL